MRADNGKQVNIDDIDPVSLLELSGQVDSRAARLRSHF